MTLWLLPFNSKSLKMTLKELYLNGRFIFRELITRKLMINYEFIIIKKTEQNIYKYT